MPSYRRVLVQTYSGLLCVITVLVLLVVPGIVLAQETTDEIEVISLESSSVFAEEVIFRLLAQSSVPIEEVALFYRPSSSTVFGLAYPQFRTLNAIEAEWTWELRPGSLPPGVEILYYWVLRDTTGREHRTEERGHIYHDDRFEWTSHGAGMVNLYSYRGQSQEQLLNAALESIDALQRDIGVTLDAPIHIYVYANRTDMRLAIPSRSERYDEMTTTLGMVVSDDTLLLLGSGTEIERTLAHELSHIVVGLATKNPLGGLPRWLDEGLAMYAEGDLPARNRRALQRAIDRDQLISVRSLSGYAGDPAQVDLFYAESHSLVTFMLEEFGREKMLALLNAFKEGMYQEEALQQVYGFGLDELDARWRQHLGLTPRLLVADGEVEVTPAIVESRPEAAARGLCASGLAPAIVGFFFVTLWKPAARKTRT